MGFKIRLCNNSVKGKYFHRTHSRRKNEFYPKLLTNHNCQFMSTEQSPQKVALFLGKRDNKSDFSRRGLKFDCPSSTLIDSINPLTDETAKILESVSSEERHLITRLRQNSLCTSRITELFCRLKRRAFIPSTKVPYADIPQPIGYNATISAPHMHALALEALDRFLQPGSRILDVGSGSGYLTAAFGMLVSPGGKAIGVDHIKELVDSSIQNVSKSVAAKALKEGSIEFHCSDGRLGWGPEAPYNAIHVGAAVEKIPKALIEQLANGGRMILPVGSFRQELYIVDKGEDGTLSYHSLVGVRFIPLTDESEQRKT